MAGLLGLGAAVLWNLFWLAGMAWLYDSSTGARFADSVGGLAFLQFGALIAGFLLCLWGSDTALRWATICAVVALVLVLAIGVIGAQSGDGYWEFAVVFAIPDLLLAVGIATMSRRRQAGVS